jgi:DNA end-binding protein Ku
MPRAMWKGAISFGLVTIRVAVFPATEEKTLRFNQLHAEDGGRIRQRRVCSIDGEEVPFDEIVKGYEYEKDRYVTLDDDDFAAVPAESSRAIDIHQFVDLADIDPILYKKSYYLVPEPTGVKAYALLREAMAEESKVGIAKVNFRDKEHLAALRFKDEAFVLETMYWPDEIRGAELEGVDVDEKVRDQELAMAKQLIENLTGEWNPEEYHDEVREALLDIVEKKIAGEEIEIRPEAPAAKVVDLMEALKASVAAAKEGEAPEASASGPERSAKRAKSAAKKTPAKRSGAKKSAAKRSSAKRTPAPRKKAVGQ